MEVGVFAGAHHVNYYFTENIFGNANKATYNHVIPSVGVSTRYIFANSLEQFALSLSAQYQHKKIEHSYKLGKSWLISDTFNSSNILMAANFRYSIPFIGQVRPYISGGPVLKYYVDPGISLKKEVFDYEGDLVTGQDYHFEFSTFVPGMSFALGATYQRFNFEVRYYRESANEFSKKQGSIRTNSLSLLAYYNIVY